MIGKNTTVKMQTQSRKKLWIWSKTKTWVFTEQSQTVMEQTPKGVRVIEDKRIIDAAGVEHMEGDASNNIQGAPNWSNQQTS